MKKKRNNIIIDPQIRVGSLRHQRDKNKPKVTNYIYDKELNRYVEKSEYEENKHSPKKNRATTNRYISQKTKNAVWRRDKGRCVECGSRKNLEFDHIIPVSEGGSNTARNIEILCELHNRKKSNRI